MVACLCLPLLCALSCSLDKYTCVALAGVCTEYLRFGQAEGGVGDVAQLDKLFAALQVRCFVEGRGGGSGACGGQGPQGARVYAPTTRLGRLVGARPTTQVCGCQPSPPPHHALFTPQFTQKKADAQVRWAVLNVVTLLRRHAGLQDKLAAAMGAGASVGACVALLERELADAPLI
jgi:hypothetical protein